MFTDSHLSSWIYISSEVRTVNYYMHVNIEDNETDPSWVLFIIIRNSSHTWEHSDEGWLIQFFFPIAVNVFFFWNNNILSVDCITHFKRSGEI